MHVWTTLASQYNILLVLCLLLKMVSFYFTQSLPDKTIQDTLGNKANDVTLVKEKVVVCVCVCVCVCVREREREREEKKLTQHFCMHS